MCDCTRHSLTLIGTTMVQCSLITDSSFNKVKTGFNSRGFTSSFSSSSGSEISVGVKLTLAKELFARMGKLLLSSLWCCFVDMCRFVDVLPHLAVLDSCRIRWIRATRTESFLMMEVATQARLGRRKHSARPRMKSAQILSEHSPTDRGRV
jgi:hypothetical protein